MNAYEKFTATMIILEIKLSEDTDLTPGQEAAKNHVAGLLNYKSASQLDEDLTDQFLIPAVSQGQDVLTTIFYKGYKGANEELIIEKIAD